MKKSDKIDTKRIEADVNFIGGQTSLTNKEEKIISEYIIMKSMQKKKVLVFLAKGFETMEFSVFIDVLGWARNDYGLNLFVDT